MNLIAHRKNTIADLRATNRRYGLEVDIRSHGQSLIIHHDPFILGESFEEWLHAYEHGTLILNVKEEGLESRLITLMAASGNMPQGLPIRMDLNILVKRMTTVSNMAMASLLMTREHMKVFGFITKKTVVALKLFKTGQNTMANLKMVD